MEIKKSKGQVLEQKDERMWEMDILLDELLVAEKKLRKTRDKEAKEYLKRYIAELKKDIERSDKDAKNQD